MKNKIKCTSVLLLMPTLVFGKTLGDLVSTIIGKWMEGLITLLMAMAVVGIFWNIFKVAMSDNPQKKKDGMRGVVFSIILLVVFVGILGIINMVIGSLELDTGGTLDFKIN